MRLWPFIEAEEAGQRSVKRACDLLEVSRAAYYEQRKHVPSRRALDDAELTGRIKQIHAASKGTYGAPRIHAQLRRDGICCAKKRVARLMVRAGLAGRCPRKRRRTTIADPNAQDRAVDLIRRAFGPGVELDRRWCGDITYIPTWEGWAYLATVIDIASRKVVGWALADHMRTDLAADALRMACARRRPPAGVIFYADRGGSVHQRGLRRSGRRAGRHALGRPQGPVLGQRPLRELVRRLQDRAHPHPALAHPCRPAACRLRVHRGLVQHPPAPQQPRLSDPHRVRGHPGDRRSRGMINTPTLSAKPG